MEPLQRRSIAIKALLRRYLSNRVTAQEAERVSTWYDSLDDKQEAAIETAAERARIHALITNRVVRKTLPVYKRYRWAAAASIAALLVASGLYYYYQQLPRAREVYTSIKTGRAEHKRTQLPDGTTVVLNAATTLLIPSDYNQQQRQVILSGEAYFEVKDNAAKPFKIQSGALNTTVLGTTFNIKAYPEQSAQSVNVSSGKVRVQTAGHPAPAAFILTKNESLRYTVADKSVQLSTASDDITASWQSGALDFSHATISDMVGDLQRQYGISIQLHTTAADTGHYVIRLQRQQLEQVLEVLSGLTGISYYKKQGTIIIHTKTYTVPSKEH